MIAEIELEPPWLQVTFKQPVQACSWAIIGGGWSRVQRVVWRQVTNADLPPEREPVAWLKAQLMARSWSDSLAFLTSHPLQHYLTASEEQAGVRVDCVATVGLGNARRVGDPPGPGRLGTINVMCAVSVPLNEQATLEVMALVAEARATACLAFQYPSPISGQPITGTGTDCIAVISPTGGDGLARYAGKHTVIGHLIGKTVIESVKTGIETWERERQHS